MNRDLNDAHVKTHNILEIVWGHSSTAITDVIGRICMPNSPYPSWPILSALRKLRAAITKGEQDDK